MTSLMKKCLEISKSGTYSNGLHFISNETMVPAMEIDSKDTATELHSGYIIEERYHGSTTLHSGLLGNHSGLYRSGLYVTNESMIRSLDVALKANRFESFYTAIVKKIITNHVNFLAKK